MTKTVVWFRRDLRVGDNWAVAAAAKGSDPYGVFVVDPTILSLSASPVRASYLKSALLSLDSEMGQSLCVLSGETSQQLLQFCLDHEIAEVFTSSDGSGTSKAILERVRNRLAEISVQVTVADTPFAVPPGELVKADGSRYRVFTPFFRAWRDIALASSLDARSVGSKRVHFRGVSRIGPMSLGPLDVIPEYSGPFSVTSEGIELRISDFIDSKLKGYDSGRDVPALDATSRLSPALHFGRLHPRTLIRRAHSSVPDSRFVAELAWRDFYGEVLAANPESSNRSLNPEFDLMRWDEGEEADLALGAWKRGETGFPIVDAGMRQLLTEGYIHNRARMIVASFLVKDLHIDWRIGARHFMDLLVDGDVASNVGGWQWVAGCGTDAAPFFRIFNPTLQGQRFDPSGSYIRRYVPELQSVQDSFIHEPAVLGSLALEALGYPMPICDHKLERTEALLRLAEIRDLRSR